MFKGRQFDRSVILLGLRWYLACNLGLHIFAAMMAAGGIFVDHATVGRWVICYSPELLNRFDLWKQAIQEAAYR
jgi:transposase-like protein